MEAQNWVDLYAFAALAFFGFFAAVTVVAVPVMLWLEDRRDARRIANNERVGQ
jgi:hypothetical protein